ncbi:MAG: TrmJ/YjtD family RNA methyltransferase [Spirochaetales bacterium]|nr:TrmJ/YjtD family RNA methyltransferase [Spirochaetales bacterium]
MTDFSNIRIVLENPKSSKNVGAVCRAMKNMGFSNLYIAGNTEVDFQKAKVTAIHAFDLLENAVFCSSVEEALSGTIISAATSRRRGKKRKYFSMKPEEFAQKIIPMSGEGKGEIAIVFGNEVSGLNDHDMALCNTAVKIPTSDQFPSLNLSHAVQIITYEIYKEALNNTEQKGYRPINREELDGLTASIAGDLKEIGFFKQVDDSDMRIFFRDVFARSGLSAGEAKRLDDIFTKIRGLASR